LTEKLLTQFKDRITGLNLVPSAGGKFEVSVDGELIYSKLETGNFPEYKEIVSQL
jgi:selenoprotein W-related protein